MQRLFYSAPGADQAVEVDPADLPRLREAGGWVWLDIVGIEPVEVQAIADRFGFDHLAVEDVLEVSQHPKVDDYPDHTMAVLMGIADDENRLRTVEYDVFVGSGYLVSFLHEDLPGFEWMREHLTCPGRLAALGPSRFLAVVLDAEASRFRALVDGLEEQVEAVEERSLAADPSSVGEVHALRRDALRLRRVIAPQEDAIHRLATEETAGIEPRARMRLSSIENQYERALESLDTSRSLLGAALEAHRVAATEKGTEVMKVLTVFAATILPLSLIAGVYGMNFAHMPELGWRWAYFGVLGLMAAVAIGIWWYFARRGFLGRPRLDALPKALGRGLVGAVRLTTRPVAGLGRVVRGRAHPNSGDH